MVVDTNGAIDYTLDELVSITIHNPSGIKIKMLKVDVPRPYLKHDVAAGKTYLVRKSGVIEEGELCNVIKNVIKNPDTAEAFKDTYCIEFYKEDAADISPKIRAMALRANLIVALKDLPIEISAPSWPTSRIEGNNKYPYAEYVQLSTDVEKGIYIQKIDINPKYVQKIVVPPRRIRTT